MNSSSPAEIPSKPRAAKEFVSSQASGAPSKPCFGASLRFLIVDRMIAIGRSSSRAPRTEDFFPGLRPSLRLVILTSSKLQPSALFSFRCRRNGSVAATFPVRRHLNVTRRFSFMNQGIRTLIYPVKDAQRSSMLVRRLLGVDPCVEQPYYLAFRLGDQEIGLDAMDVFPLLERNSTLPRSTSPTRLTTTRFTPKMKIVTVEPNCQYEVCLLRTFSPCLKTSQKNCSAHSRISAARASSLKSTSMPRLPKSAKPCSKVT